MILIFAALQFDQPYFTIFSTLTAIKEGFSSQASPAARNHLIEYIRNVQIDKDESSDHCDGNYL